VSGDSLGVVKFWDSRTGTQLQSFQGHAADVLCMTIGPVRISAYVTSENILTWPFQDGTAVYTSGVDQKVTQFSLVKPSTGPNTSLLRTGNRWIQAASRRLHSHDVRALAIWPPYAPIPAAHLLNSGVYRFPADIAPILASGGLDMSVTLTPAALPRATSHRLVNPLGTSTSGTFEDAYHRRVAYPTGAAGTSALSLARGARMIACAADARVSVWRPSTIHHSFTNGI
jgi:U3 small nucleolar RNA-associated protein 4